MNNRFGGRIQVGFDDSFVATKKLDEEPVQHSESTTQKGVIFDNWRNAKNRLSQAQSEEKQARNNVMEWVKEEIKEGTNRFSTNHFTLKIAHAPKYKVDSSDLGALNSAMQAISQITGAEVASQLLSWSPTLNKKVYDNLPDNAKQIIGAFLTMTYSDTFSIEDKA